MRISDWSSDVCSSDLNCSTIRSVILCLRGADQGVGNGKECNIYPRVDRRTEQRQSSRSPHTGTDDRGAAEPQEGLEIRTAHARQRRASPAVLRPRSEEHTSELQSLMRISYAVFCLKK